MKRKRRVARGTFGRTAFDRSAEVLEQRRLLAGDFSPFDIDADGIITRSDSELVARYLGGFTGDSLTDGLVNPRGDRNTASLVVAYLDGIRESLLDADGDFETHPLNDASLLARYTQGVTGSDLINGTVNPIGTRVQSENVVRYFQRALNVAPTGQPIQYTTAEDMTLTVPAANGVLVNDTDTDGGPLSAELYLPAGHGVVELSTNGEFTYQPIENFNGVDRFSYVAFDGIARSSPTQVQVVVQAVNDPPTSPQREYFTHDGQTLVVPAATGLLSAAFDADGDAMSLRVVSLPKNGTLAVKADGSFEYLPNADFYGRDEFVFGLNDGKVSTRQTVMIEVNGTNTVPVAKPLQYFVDEDGILEVDAANGIFSGGTDVDGDTLALTDFQRPDFGEWEYRVDGSFEYKPPADFFGNVQFLYAVADDDGHTSEQVAGTITVRPVYDPPEPQGDVYDLPANTRLKLTGSDGVIRNDRLRDAILPQIDIIRLPTHGTIAFTTDAAGAPILEYVPDADFLGDDTFSYGLKDGNSTTYGNATVNVSVTPRGAIRYSPETRVISVFGIEGDEHIQIIESFTELGPDAPFYVGMWNSVGTIAEFETTVGRVSRIVVRNYSGDDIVEAFAGSAQSPSFPTVHVFGGDGDDTIYGGFGNDFLYGEGGNDTIYGDRGDDIIEGGPGFDSLSGGNGNDELSGGDDGDFIVGQGGADTLRGGTGDDGLMGDGDDALELSPEQPGNDILLGEEGDDTLTADLGNNELHGGNGSDYYYFGPDVKLGASSQLIFDSNNFNVATATSDTNTLDFSAYEQAIYFDLNQPRNLIGGQLEVRLDDPLTLHTLIGGQSDDYLVGHRLQRNEIYGGNGNDQLMGGDQVDRLFGEGDDDTLYGGPGDDFLDGGPGGQDIAYGGPGVNQIVNATQPGNPIQVQSSNTLTRFGRKFISVKIQGTDFDDRVEIRSTGTLLQVKVTPDINRNSPSAPLPSFEQAIDFTDAYLDYQFYGGKGNDFYQDSSNLSSFGFGGTVYGGDGNDTLIGGSGIDVLIGGPGNDLLVGGAGRDTIDGNEGDDTLAGGLDSDLLAGGEGNDVYRYDNPGDIGDLISERYNAENPSDGGDRDTLDFRSFGTSVALDLSNPDNAGPVRFSQTARGIERVLGSAFSDWIIGHAGANFFDGGAGNDTLEGGGGPDTLLGGDGDDFIFGALNGISSLDLFGNFIDGGAGNDFLVGGDGFDQILGGDGNDRIWGMRGNDQLEGHQGFDTISGGDGDDRIRGGSGSDILRGDDGRDDIAGGDDADTIDGGSQSDTLQGGNGDDSIEGGDGADLIFGDNGNDELFGGQGEDELQGGAGDDVLDGGSGGDTLFGEEGADTLLGGSGQDSLVGGAGNDRVDGGDNADAMWGDGGDDVLVAPDVGDQVDGGTGTNSIVRAADRKALGEAERLIKGATDQVRRYLDNLPDADRLAISYSILEKMRDGVGFGLNGASFGEWIDEGQKVIDTVAPGARDAIDKLVLPVLRDAAMAMETEVQDLNKFVQNYVKENVASILSPIVNTVNGTVRNINQFAERIKNAKNPRAIGEAIWILSRDQVLDAARNVSAGSLHFFRTQALAGADLLRAIVPDFIMEKYMKANIGEYLDVNATPSQVVNSHLGGPPLYHVNGMNTRFTGSNQFPTGDPNQELKEPRFWFEALEEAEALSLRLGRSVGLIYNSTDSVELGDLGQSVADMNWSPPLPQHNGATKVLAGILYRHARSNEPISLSSYSQGTIIARNALETIKTLGYGDWVRDKVRWVLIGSPLGIAQINFDVHYTSLRNPRDPVAIGGNPSIASSRRGVTGIDSDTGLNRIEHNMVLSYVKWMTDDMFFPTGNGHVPGSIPPGVNAQRFSVYQRYINNAGLRRDTIFETPNRARIIAAAESDDAISTGLRRAKASAVTEAAQLITVNPSTTYSLPTNLAKLDMTYAAVPQQNSTGLHVRVHYDSSQLTFANITHELAGFSAMQVLDDSCPADNVNCGGLDENPATDQFVNLLWWDPNGNWPNAVQPLMLASIDFVKSNNWTQSTINFSGHAAGALTFHADSTNLRSTLLADFNADSAVTAADIDALFAAIRIGTVEPRFDLNEDSKVDRGDVEILVKDILRTRLGDTDLNRRVQFADFLRLSANFGKSEKHWADGDFDGNGRVDFADFLVLSASFGFDDA